MTTDADAEDQDEKLFRTNDMCLAAFFRYHGHSTQKAEYRGNSCYWLFIPTQGLYDLYEQFTEGSGLVEPREFNKAFGFIRGEMFEAQTKRRGTK